MSSLHSLASADPLSRSVFSDAMADAFIDYKRAEWDDYHACLSDLELARYFEFL